MAPQVEFDADQLSGKMVGKDMLDGWDVVVSYDVVKLNELLATRHSEVGSKLSNITDLKAPYNDPDDNSPLVRIYNLALGTPSMQIVDRQAKVNVDFTLSGTSYREDKGKAFAKPLPTGLFLRCTSELVHLTADSGTAAPSVPAGQVVTFGADKTAQYYVAIHLNKVEVQIRNAGGVETTTNVLLTQPLADYLASTGVTYHLTGINNHTSDKSSAYLKPKKFIMTSVVGDTPSGADAKPRQALITWIQLEGSESSPQANSDNSPLLFSSDKTNQISPVPHNYSASVILSHDVVWKNFIKAHLTSAGFSEITETSSIGSTTSGISFTAKTKSDIVKTDKYDESGSFDNSIDNKYCNAISFDLKDYPTTFTLDHTNTKMSFEHTVNDVEFGYYQLETKDGFSDRYRHTGLANFTFKVEGAGTWTSSQNDISLNFSLPATFTVEGKAQDPGAWDKFFKVSLTDVHEKMKKTTATIATPNFALGGIDYFLTTNLLCPGKEVFEAATPSQGLYIPRDLLICGNVKAQAAQPTQRKRILSTNATAQHVTATFPDDVTTMRVPMLSTEAPSMLNHQAVQGVGKLAEFRMALCQTNPPSEFRKVISHLIMSTDPDVDQQFDELMNRFGFDVLTPAEIGSIINLIDVPDTSLVDESIPARIAPTQATSKANDTSEHGLQDHVSTRPRAALSHRAAGSDTAITDIGVFAGLYRITSGSPPVQEILITAQDKRVKMGDELLDTTSLTSEGRLWFSWTSSDGSTYDAHFSNKWDEVKKELQTSFIGHQTNSSNAKVEFNGIRTARNLRPDKDKVSEGGVDEWNLAAAILGLILGVGGIAFYWTLAKKVLNYCKKRSQTAPQGSPSANQAHDLEAWGQRAIEAMAHSGKNGEERLRTASITKAREGSTATSRAQLISDINAATGQIIREYYTQQDIQNHPELTLNPNPSGFDANLMQQLRDSVRDLARTWANSNAGANVRLWVNGFAEGSFMDPLNAETVSNDALNSEGTRVSDSLTNSHGDHFEAFWGGVASAIHVNNREVLVTDILRHEENLTKAREEIKAAQERINQAKKDEQKNEQRANKDEEYEKEKKRIEEELKVATEKKKEEEKREEEATVKKEKAEEAKKQNDENETQNEVDKKKAEKKFKEHS